MWLCFNSGKKYDQGKLMSARLDEYYRSQRSEYACSYDRVNGWWQGHKGSLVRESRKNTSMNQKKLWGDQHRDDEDQESAKAEMVKIVIRFFYHKKLIYWTKWYNYNRIRRVKGDMFKVKDHLFRVVNLGRGVIVECNFGFQFTSQWT